MESSLTKMELDAVLQLIQLSVASDGGGGPDIRIVCVDFRGGKDEESNNKGEEEGSAGDALSSSVVINPENCVEAEEEDDDDDGEVLPRIKSRFGSLLDVYGRTRSPIDDRAKKRSRF